MYGLGYARTEVIKVTTTTSVIGYCPSLDVFRYLHHQILALMNSVPIRPYTKLNQIISGQSGSGLLFGLSFKTYANYSKANEGNQFKEYPGFVVLDIK